MSRRLDVMRRNPSADWRIEDVVALCHEFDILCDHRAAADRTFALVTHEWPRS